jgi:hypothetical protein
MSTTTLEYATQTQRFPQFGIEDLPKEMRALMFEMNALIGQ